MRDDNGVPVPSGDLAEEPAAVLALEVLFRGCQDLGARVKAVEVGGPLLNKVVRDADHRLAGKACALQLDSRRDGRERLAGAYDVVGQRRPLLQHAGNEIALVPAELDDGVRDLSGERQPRSVVDAGDVVVVRVVVGSYQNLRPIGVREQPVLELVADVLGLVVGCLGFVLEGDGAAVVKLLGDLDRSVVQHRHQDAGCPVLRDTVGADISDVRPRDDDARKGTVRRDVGKTRAGTFAEQVLGEVFVDAGRNPRGADPCGDLSSANILRQDLL